MPHRRAPRYDPDERFSLYPLTGEEVLEKLLGAPAAEGAADEDDPDRPEGDDS